MAVNDFDGFSEVVGEVVRRTYAPPGLASVYADTAWSSVSSLDPVEAALRLLEMAGYGERWPTPWFVDAGAPWRPVGFG